MHPNPGGALDASTLITGSAEPNKVLGSIEHSSL